MANPAEGYISIIKNTARFYLSQGNPLSLSLLQTAIDSASKTEPIIFILDAQCETTRLVKSIFAKSLRELKNSDM